MSGGWLVHLCTSLKKLFRPLHQIWDYSAFLHHLIDFLTRLCQHRHCCIVYIAFIYCTCSMLKAETHCAFLDSALSVLPASFRICRPKPHKSSAGKTWHTMLFLQTYRAVCSSVICIVKTLRSGKAICRSGKISCLDF